MKIFSLVSAVNILWQYLFIPLLLSCGILLTLRCSFLQFHALPHLTRKLKLDESARPRGSLSGFEAASAALSSAVGTGNIIGTAQAITLGGAGALFWLWISAFLSMIIKYAEICLAIRYNSSGSGVFSYISAAGGRRAAKLFALFTALASLAVGNAVQTHSIISAVRPMLPNVSGAAVRTVLCLVLCGASLMMLVSGVRGAGRISALLFPLMSLMFLVSAAAVIAANLTRLPEILKSVLSEALSPRAFISGASGSSLVWGIRRGIFSNEAGIGSAAISHSQAAADNPAEHGLWGVAEVFADSVVICGAAGLAILCSGVDIPRGVSVGAELYTAAVATVFGARPAAAIICAVLCLFSFSSMLGWSMYGRLSAQYIGGIAGERRYCALFLCVIPLSCVMSTEAVWLFSDCFIMLMALPNLLALFLLSGEVEKLSGELKLDEPPPQVYTEAQE